MTTFVYITENTDDELCMCDIYLQYPKFLSKANKSYFWHAERVPNYLFMSYFIKVVSSKVLVNK